MRRTTWLPLAVSLTADIAPWAVLSGGFLLIYVFHFGASSNAVIPHLKLVAILWGGIASLKLAGWRTYPPTATRRAILSLPTAITLGGLLVFYIAVLVGLASWRRVINWQLVSTYAGQVQPTLQALDIQPWQPAVVLCVGFAVIWFLSARLWNGEYWLRAIAAKPVLGHGLGFSIAGLLAGGMLLAHSMTFPATREQEPFGVSIFHEANESELLQSHSRAGLEVLDARESEASARYRPAAPPNRRNVVLVISDALRADRAPWAGYHRPVTPFLKSLTERLPSAHVDNMRAVCAESSCGLLGLISSRYVHASPAHPFTLQDVLRLHGYRTEMVLAGDHTNFYGLRQRYGQSDGYFDGSMQSRYYVNDDRLVLEHVAGMPNRDPNVPVVMQFHLMSTHGLGKRHPESNRYQPAHNYYRRWLLDGNSEAFRAQAVNYYDNGVLQFDATLRELVPMLAQKGYLDDALLVVTGDHGDQLGEHDTYAHANSTWEPALRIPFVMIDFGGGLPTFPPQAVTSQADIAPTILQALGMPVPETWQGTPLQTVKADRVTFFQEGFATGLYDTAAPGSVYKYWRDWHAQQEHVFRIDTDPDEQRDLVTRVGAVQLARWRRLVLGNVAAGGIDAFEHRPKTPVAVGAAPN